MNSMKGFLILVGFISLFLMICHYSEAQKLRYRDIIPEIVAADDGTQHRMIREYLMEDSENPNLNLRAALHSERNYRKNSILTDFDFCMGNADRARLLFLKSGILINEREIDRNLEFYNGVLGHEVKVNFSLIDQKIKNGYDSAGLFLKMAPPIYNAFTKSVDFYDQVIRSYAGINGRFSNRDDLLMYFNDDLKSELIQLKANYDSALHYFDLYRNLYQEYPLVGTHQTYEIRPIRTYRLDGLLARMNFLEPKLIFWDYGTWVDGIIKEEKEVIAPLRKRLMEMERSLQASIDKAATTEVQNYEPVKLSKSTLFQLKKYDNNSLLAPLLEYRAFKQAFENRLQNRNYFSKEMGLETSRIHIYYSEVINKALLGDSLVKRAARRLNAGNVEKHPEHFKTFFKGEAGLEAYLKAEREKIDHSINEFVLLLRNSLIESHQETLSTGDGSVRHKGFDIDLHPQTFEGRDLEPGQSLTLHAARNLEGKLYLGGIYKPTRNQQHLTGFVACLNQENRILWFKDYNVEIDSTGADSHNYVTSLELTQEGCAFTITARHMESKALLNTLIYLDESGKEKFRKSIPETGFPRTLIYRENNNSFLVGMMGSAYQQNPFERGILDLWAIHASGDLLWEESIAFSGTLEGGINTQAGYLLTGNFSEITTVEGKTYHTNTRARQTNAFLMKLSQGGIIESTKTLANAKSYFLRDIKKVNDGNINIFGFDLNYSTNHNRPLDFDNNLLHLITNQDLDIISFSLD